jgi:hemerythrin superfamily protein
MKSDVSFKPIDDEADGPAETDGPAEAGTDVISLLMADHSEVRQLFADYDALVADDASDETRGDLARQICLALSVHASVEEELFYPALRDAADEDDMVDEAVAEHARARELIELLEEMEPSDDLYDATVRTLQETVEQHVVEEEEELFARARQSKLDLDSLGDQVAERKQELLSELEAHAV